MSVPVCRFYSTNRRCAFGRHCRYQHCRTPRTHFPVDSGGNINEYLEDPSSLKILSLSDKHSHADTIHQDEGKLIEQCSIISYRSEQHQDHTDNLDSQHDSHLTNKRPVKQNKAICFYYKKHGKCHYGNDCRFSHDIISNSEHSYKRNISNKQQRSHGKLAEVPPRFRKKDSSETEVGAASGKSNADEDLRQRHLRSHDYQQISEGPQRIGNRGNNYRSTERRVCQYFKRGYCSKGDYCQLLHSNDWYSELKTQVPTPVKPDDHTGQVQVDSRESQSTTAETNVIDKTYFEGANRPINYSTSRTLPVKQMFVDRERDDRKLRESEINIIKKRFPQDKLTVLEETDNSFSARILFSPTDPDWTFDIRVYELLVTLPSNYPKQMMHVVLPMDQNLPETVRRYVEISIKEWLDKKVNQSFESNNVELLFRPFLLWLDRNIEDITMEALKQLKRELVAKAAGMEFIPAEKLQAKFRVDSELCSGKEYSETDEASQLTDESGDSSNDSVDDSDEEIVETAAINPDKKGTEIELRHLQMQGNASALMFDKLKLILQCARCKNHSDILVSPGKVMSVQCEKCSQNQFVHYRSSLIHQFSSVVGYLDVDGCQAFDMIFQECVVSVTCFGCSKQTRINGLASGHMTDSWCQACNARFKLFMEAVKFAQLIPSSIDTSVNKSVQAVSSKSKRPPKDPAIREGCPLPEFGTCKHYKHSYRWLRFPCCGKAYPCDVCHDKKEDHEMVYATRMICGHCCREQSFSATRPCSSCGHHLTKIRTSHWEGGSGCRDKISMSKNDQHKYKNGNKTQSNHQKKVQLGAQKKVTKLRHI